MQMQSASAEDWIKKFDAALAKGRGVSSESSNADRSGAIEDLKALGLTEGDAEYWLSRKGKS